MSCCIDILLLYFCFKLSGMFYSVFDGPVQTPSIYYLTNQNLNSKNTKKKIKKIPNTVMQ